MNADQVLKNALSAREHQSRELLARWCKYITDEIERQLAQDPGSESADVRARLWMNDEKIGRFRYFSFNKIPEELQSEILSDLRKQGWHIEMVRRRVWLLKHWHFRLSGWSMKRVGETYREAPERCSKCGRTNI